MILHDNSTKNTFDPNHHLQIIKVYKQSNTINSSNEIAGTNNSAGGNSSYFLNNYYIYVIKYNGNIINRRYNEFELLYQILRKLFLTDLLPSIPKKESIMDLVKQQANNSIDLTSKTLASGYSNLLHLKDSFLSYTSGTTVVSHDENDLEDPDKFLNTNETKTFKFSIPKNHMLNDVDLTGVSDKDIKLIRHRCIFFQDFLNELINNDKIFNENNILKEFLNNKNINFVDFIKSYSLINQTLLSNDVLRLNPSDPLGTEDFYKYLPLPSVTGRGSLPKVPNLKKQSSNCHIAGEDAGSGDGEDDDEAIESDDSDYDNGLYWSGSDDGFLGEANFRRVSEPTQKFSRTPSFSQSLQAAATNTRNSNDSKRPHIDNMEAELIAYLKKNNDKFQKAEKLVKEYKKKIVSKMLKNIKKLSKDFDSLKTIQESYMDSLKTYHLFDPSLPLYDSQIMVNLDKVVDDLCAQLYYNCLEKMKELDAFNDNCLQLIKFSKNKLKQKELLKILIDNETLKLEHLQKKIEMDSEVSAENQNENNNKEEKAVEENTSNNEANGKIDKNGSPISTVDDNDTTTTQPVQSVSNRFSPFIKKLSTFTAIVKDKYTHSLQPTKLELQNKVVQLQEILQQLEKNEKCINDDIMFILNEVYDKDIDQFTKKIDREILQIINIISEAMRIYSSKSLDIWKEISTKYTS